MLSLFYRISARFQRSSIKICCKSRFVSVFCSLHFAVSASLKFGSNWSNRFFSFNIFCFTVTLKVVPKTACDPENCLKVDHECTLEKLTNESKGNPDQKILCGFRNNFLELVNFLTKEAEILNVFFF